MPQPEASILWVEGKDDLHAIGHLLWRHGVDLEDIPVDIKTPGDSEDEPAGDEPAGDEPAGGRDPLLEGMETAVMASTGRAAGFVLDADEVAQDRWRAVRGRLERVGLTLPDEIPRAGYVGHAGVYQARVGVWLMPDNRRSGALEDFLQDLVDSRDSVLQVAEESTDLAKGRGAPFADSQRSKAVLHAWLAWQESPGLPYGSAIRARYFRHDSPAALAFVEWFKSVFLP